MSRSSPRGRLKAVAADFWQLINSPSTGRTLHVLPPMSRQNYRDLTHEQLVSLLEARDRRTATRYGLVWETDGIEAEQALNGDYVALDLVPELCCGPPPWRNLVIEGDNFDALRALKPGFSGKVRCLATDPPYNTGNRDFLYNDRFIDKDDLWRHSKWLEFMFQRLTLAHDLLAEDGAAFIHIDDNEVFNLGLLMNKVFGESNFIANCIWQKRYSRENREAIGDAHEYVLIYAIDPDRFKKLRGKIPLDEKQAAVYKNPNKDLKGRWRGIPMTAQGFRPNQMYPITSPDGTVHLPPEGRCWSTVESEFLKLKDSGRVYWGKKGSSQPSTIRYLSEVEGLVPWTWWTHEEVGHTDESKKEIHAIMGKEMAFSTPKPTRLLDRILQIGCDAKGIVLDIFAGSGTTGHAVLKANAADGGNRRFVMVSNSEATAEEPDKNLCRDVCAERMRRVAAGYTKTDGTDVPGLGGGFAYLRCRRVPVGSLLELEHPAVWTALQLRHLEAIAPYDSEAPFQWAEEGDSALCYVPRFRKEDLKALRERVDASGSVVIYSWQPGLLRQHLRRPLVTHETLPTGLTRPFGLRI